MHKRRNNNIVVFIIAVTVIERFMNNTSEPQIKSMWAEQEFRPAFEKARL